MSAVIAATRCSGFNIELTLQLCLEVLFSFQPRLLCPIKERAATDSKAIFQLILGLNLDVHALCEAGNHGRSLFFRHWLFFVQHVQRFENFGVAGADFEFLDGVFVPFGMYQVLHGNDFSLEDFLLRDRGNAISEIIQDSLLIRRVLVLLFAASVLLPFIAADH